MRSLEIRRWLGVTIAVLLSLAGIAVAEEAGGPGLKKAKEHYESSRMLKVDAPFEVELDKLNRQLDKALAGAEEAAIESGNLDLVTAYQSERKTLADSGRVPDLDDGIPAKIRQFRSAWRKKKAALDSERAALGRRLMADFDAELQQLETTLTKERKIEDALAVRKYRNELAKQTAARTAEPAPASATGADSNGGWVTILDGKSLDGWRADLPANFMVVEGGIMARKAKQKGNARLYYTGDDQVPDLFESFEVRIRARLEGDQGNSGFYFHVPPAAVEKRVDGGFEVNIANGKELRNQTGSIWDIKNVNRPIRGQDRSFELLIKVTEDQLTAFYDGRKIMDHVPKKDADRPFTKGGGAIAIQANSFPGAYVFEQIDIRKLD